jgi:hypothetical protein
MAYTVTIQEYERDAHIPEEDSEAERGLRQQEE